MTIAEALKLLKDVPGSTYVNIDIEIACHPAREDRIEFTVTLFVGKRPSEMHQHISRNLDAAVNHVLARCGIGAGTSAEVSEGLAEVEAQP